MFRGQVDEYATCRQVCPECLCIQTVKYRRRCRRQTLFGAEEVKAPRFRNCRCRLPPGDAAFSPVTELLPGRRTPELERMQAEVGAWTPFRKGGRILEMLLPVSSVNQSGSQTGSFCLSGLEAGDEPMTPSTKPAEMWWSPRGAHRVLQVQGACP
jgi:hypothetical protein